MRYRIAFILLSLVWFMFAAIMAFIPPHRWFDIPAAISYSLMGIYSIYESAEAL